MDTDSLEIPSGNSLNASAFALVDDLLEAPGAVVIVEVVVHLIGVGDRHLILDGTRRVDAGPPRLPGREPALESIGFSVIATAGGLAWYLAWLTLCVSPAG